MFGKLSALKNLLWAVGIVVCLGALLVGLIFASAVKYDGSGQVESFSEPEESAQPSAAPPTGNGTLMSLPETEDKGQAYVDSLTFLCDSALIGLRDYGLLSGGMVTTQVWGSSAGNIPAADIATCTIKYPADGSQVSAANAAMVSQPGILVISLGTDSLAATTQEDFIANYTALLNAIRAASPDTRIICCSLTSVSNDYSGVDGLTSALVGEANEWIRQVCTDLGVYYADAASAVSDSSGVLFSEYVSANGKTLNVDGINQVLLYLRTHAL